LLYRVQPGGQRLKGRASGTERFVAELIKATTPASS